MSYSLVVGQIKGERDPINIEWKIADFLSLPADASDVLESPMFCFCNASWYLQLYPNVIKGHSREGYIGVYVFKDDSDLPVTVTCTVFLKKTNGRKVVVDKETCTFSATDDEGYGQDKVIRRSKLINEKSKFMPSGVLTVVCSLESDEAKVVGGTKKLSIDLTGLLASGFGSDVTIRVRGKELRCHRAILAARNPVFSSMFTHDMQEKATGVVSIDDCEVDPLCDFIYFLYSGGTDVISLDNVYSLYKIADKYQDNELKDSCLKLMMQTLSIRTFCSTLELALNHEERALIELATDFLSKNSSSIMVTEEFQNLMKNNMIQMNKLLMQIIEHKNKKN